MPLFAQNTVVSFSTTVHTGDAAAAACSQQRAIIVAVIDAFPRPDKWMWIVACDEASWEVLQARTRRADRKEAMIMALTDLTAGRTFVRGYYVLHPVDERDLAKADHIVAHELCHIYLHSADEMRVDALSQRWFRDRNAVRIAENDR